MGTREFITEAAKSLGITENLKLIEPHRYQGILERIIAARTSLNKDATSAMWWWESLLDPVSYMQPGDSVSALESLVPRGEAVWLVAEACGSKKNGNFWLYEATIEAVCSVLRETPPFEFYVVSKKMHWLICENHHGQLIASGEPVAGSLAAMPNRSLEPTSLGKPRSAAQLQR